MQTSALKDGYHAEIDQIVTDLFQTMLETEVAATTPDQVTTNSLVTALIAFAGTWTGTLALECEQQQAVFLAQKFLQDDTMVEFNDDVRDAFGELANIVAGNLKVALPSGVSIGMPSIVEGRDYFVSTCGGKIVDNSVFSNQAGVFSVRLIEDSKTVE